MVKLINTLKPLFIKLSNNFEYYQKLYDNKIFDLMYETALKKTIYSSEILEMEDTQRGAVKFDEYNIYMTKIYASTTKIFEYQEYIVTTFAGTVNDWFNLRNKITEVVDNYGISGIVNTIAGDIGTYHIINKFLKGKLLTLSKYAQMIDIPIEIFLLLASDFSETLLNDIWKIENKNSYYIFNWNVILKSSFMGYSEMNVRVLESYCLLAAVLGVFIQ